MAEVMRVADMNFACIEDPADAVAATLGMTAVGSDMCEASDNFEKLALDQMDTLFRVARRLTRDGERANDLVQETYLQAWRSFHRFEPGTNCRAWLYKILLFSHARQQRRQTRRPTCPP